MTARADEIQVFGMFGDRLSEDHETPTAYDILVTQRFEDGRIEIVEEFEDIADFALVSSMVAELEKKYALEASFVNCD